MCRAISLSAAFYNRRKAAVNFLFAHDIIAPNLIVIGAFFRRLIGERSLAQCLDFFKPSLFGSGAEDFITFDAGNFRPFHFYILFTGGLCRNQARR